MERASKLGMTKFLAAVDDPHIDHEMERSKALRGDGGGNYDPVSDRFTKAFAKKNMINTKTTCVLLLGLESPFEYLTAIHLMTGGQLGDVKMWNKMRTSLERLVQIGG